MQVRFLLLAPMRNPLYLGDFFCFTSWYTHYIQLTFAVRNHADLCCFFVNIYRNIILKIPIELQPHIKALVLILMHINRFHQQPQVRITDVLFLDHLLQEVCRRFQLVKFSLTDLICIDFRVLLAFSYSIGNGNTIFTTL